MISCILFTLYLAVSGLPAGTIPAQQPNADAVYAQRADLAKARQAADLWEQQLRANAADFNAAWKLARAKFWLGGHASANERKMFLESGIAAGRAAVAQDRKS